MANSVKIPGLTGGVNYGSPRDQLADNEMAAGSNWIVGPDGVLTSRSGYTAESLYDVGILPQYSLIGTSGRIAAIRNLTDHRSGGNTRICVADNSDKKVISDCLVGLDYRNYFLYQYSEFGRIINSNSDYIRYCQVEADNTLTTPAVLGGALGYNFCHYESNSEYPYSLEEGVFDEDHYTAALASDRNRHCCRCMCIFDGRVFLGGTYEMVSDGVWMFLPYRLRWSKRRDFSSPDSWNDADPNSSAGYDHTIADESVILNMAALGDVLYVYCDNAIRAGYITQSVTAPIRFVDVNGRGLYASNAIAVTESGHYYLGCDGRVYVNRGGVEPEWIGKKIDSKLYGGINVPYKERIFAGELRDQNAIYFAVPTGSDQYPRTMYVYFYRTGVWQVWNIGNYLCCSDKYGLQFGSQNLLLTFDKSSYQDIGEYIQPYAITGDYILDISTQTRSKKLYVEAKAANSFGQLQFGYSTESSDSPGDFNIVQTVNVGDQWDRYKFTFDTGQTYKVRFMFRLVGGIPVKLGRIWTEFV